MDKVDGRAAVKNMGTIAVEVAFNVYVGGNSIGGGGRTKKLRITWVHMYYGEERVLAAW